LLGTDLDLRAWVLSPTGRLIAGAKGGGGHVYGRRAERATGAGGRDRIRSRSRWRAVRAAARSARRARCVLSRVTVCRRRARGGTGAPGIPC
ncbi:hypothetical protein ABT136_34060, partial [Streptomyces sp. NPDC001856]